MNDKRTIEETLPMSEDTYEVYMEAQRSADRNIAMAFAKKEAPCFGCDRLVPLGVSFCSDECRDEYDGYIQKA